MKDDLSIKWIPISVKPTGVERKMLAWVKWPELGWPSRPGPEIVWWKNDLGYFCIKNISCADNLITHWSEINEPE